MKNHKLIRVLAAFTKKELSEFEKFISSPFHNEGRNYLRLYKELKRFYPGFESKNLTKENVFAAVYPAKAYSENIINTALSRLLKMAEGFLSYKSYLRKNYSVKYDFIQELLERELYSMAEKELKDYTKILDASEGITDEFIKAKMDVEILKVQLGFKSDKQYESAQPAFKQADLHIRFTLMRLAHFIHTLRVNNIIFNADYKKTFVKKYLDAVKLNEIYTALKNGEENEELDEITLIYVLWIMGVTDSKSESVFYEMKELILKNLDKFHHHEKYNLFQALEAIAWILQQEVNREKFETELLNMYKKRLEHKVLSPDNTHMRIILFRAILITAFYNPDWNFIESFISTCIPLLQEEHSQNMYNYSMAHVFYHKKNYGKALEYNNKINFELFAFRYDTRLLQFKIYFELGYFEEAHSLIDSHRHFIANNKTVSDYYREMHTNFLNFYSELLRAKEGKTLDYLSVKKKIESTNNILSRQFLLDKLGELSPQNL